MSRLRIYWPEPSSGEHQVDCEDGAPVTISFKTRLEGGPRWKVADLISRARLLHQNNRCRHCGHPVIQPIELADALMNRTRMPIPGTATLVGFRCDRCQAEWPV